MKNLKRLTAIITAVIMILGLSVFVVADEYPELPTVQGGFNIEIERKVLNDMIKQTIFAVAVTDQKVVYTGIKKNTFCSRSLTCINMSHDSDVSCFFE